MTKLYQLDRGFKSSRIGFYCEPCDHEFDKPIRDCYKSRVKDEKGREQQQWSARCPECDQKATVVDAPERARQSYDPKTCKPTKTISNKTGLKVIEGESDTMPHDIDQCLLQQKWMKRMRRLDATATWSEAKYDEMFDVVWGDYTSREDGTWQYLYNSYCQDVDDPVEMMGFVAQYYTGGFKTFVSSTAVQQRVKELYVESGQSMDRPMDEFVGQQVVANDFREWLQQQ